MARAPAGEPETPTEPAARFDSRPIEPGRASDRSPASVLPDWFQISHLLSDGPAVVYSCQPDSPFTATYVSENIRGQLGYAPEQVVGRDGFWVDRVHPEDRPRMLEALSDLRDSRLNWTEYRFLHADGEYRWLHDEFRLVGSKEECPEIVGYCLDITPRRVAQQAVEEREKLLRNVIDTSPNMVFVVDVEGHILLANRASAAFYGSRPAEIEGRLEVELYEQFGMRIHELRRLRADDLRVIRKNQLVESIHFVHDRSGNGRWRRVRRLPITLTDGQKAVLVISEDIQALKETEEILRLERDRAQLYLDISGTVIVGLDNEGRVILANEAAFAFLGTPKDELIGQNWFDRFVPQSHRSQVWEVHKAVLQGDQEQVRRFKNPIIDGRGEERYLLWQNDVLRDADGRIIGSISSGIDVTEYLEAVRARSRLAAIVETANDAIIGKTLDGIITSWNAAAASLYGYNENEVIGRPVSILLPPDRDDELPAILAQIRNGKPVKHMETVRKRKDGSLLNISLSVSPIKNDQGDVIGASSVARDVTASKQAREQIQRAMEESIQAVSLLVESRDPYTAGHQRRVTQLACAIAGTMGLSPCRIVGLRLAGLVHDIGKISIPTEILTRPGDLSRVEYELLKTHPRVAYDVLSTIDFPWPVAEIVYQHHERLDGTGYPRGLRGDDILLEARIIAVADVVEAIASHRPYREALGLSVAIDEIGAARGAGLDEDVVDTCAQLLQSGSFTFEPAS